MAMKKGEARVISQEIDFDGIAARNDNNVFENSRRALAGKLCQLKSVAMQVNRMIVIALIVKSEPILGI